MGKLDELRAAMIEILGDGVVEQNTLKPTLRALGLSCTENEIRALILEDPRFIDLSGGLAFVPALIEGMTFSLHVNPEHAVQGFVPMEPWLHPVVWWLFVEGAPLLDSSGQRVDRIEVQDWGIDGQDADVIVFPQGWMNDWADRWVGFTVIDGCIQTSLLEEAPPVSDILVTHIGDTFQRVTERHEFDPFGADSPVEVRQVFPETLLLEAMVSNRQAFCDGILAPLPELIAATGLRERHHYLIQSDLEDSVFDEFTTVHRFAAVNGIEMDDALAVIMLEGCMKAFESEGLDAFGADEREQNSARIVLAGLLARSTIARVFAWQVRSKDQFTLGLRFAVGIQQVFKGDEELLMRAWGPVWLEAHCLLGLGRVAEAAELLDRLPHDDRHVQLLVDRASLAADRGEAIEAQRLLRTVHRLIDIDDPEDFSLHAVDLRDSVADLSDEVWGWASNPPAAQAGRNDRCPCGSGEKYKACHLGRELHPLNERVDWLYAKMQRFVRRRARVDHEEILEAMALAAQDAAFAETMDDFTMPIDFLLCEGDLISEFSAGLAGVLPEDEAMIAAQWSLTRRSVFEVTSTKKHSVVLKDLATGDSIKVENLTDGGLMGVGSLVMGRPLPVGDWYRALSGMSPLRPELAATALEVCESYDPHEVAHFVGSLFRPPTVQNTDGEDLEILGLAWRLPPDHDVGPALLAAGFSEDGPDQWTLVRDTVNQSRSIIANLGVVGETMTGGVNSSPRADKLVELVKEHVPEAEFLGIEEIDLGDVDLREGPIPTLTDMDDPEIMEFMEQYMAEMEANWLDESIPALGGRTPREAAVDPIGREELIRLLASFPKPPDGMSGMSGARLGAALGLHEMSSD